jgi:hypothetical protein
MLLYHEHLKYHLFNIFGLCVPCKPLIFTYLHRTKGLSVNMIVISLRRSKFGLYHVDFKDPDRKRTPKQSAFFMGRITRTRRIPPIYKIATRKLDRVEGL